MKYYYEPNDKWYDTKQELVDAWNEDFEGTHSTKVTIDNWTEEQWNIIWKPNMKKLEIKTEKATLLLVDLPYPEIWVSRAGISGNFKHLGKVYEITEEECKTIVDTGVDFVKETTHFIDYEDDFYLYKSATQSGLSLLKANGVLLANPYRDPGLIPSAELDVYRKIQEKIWSNPHVFIKVY